MRLLTFALLGSALFLASCTKSGGPVLSPIQEAGCAIESAVSGGMASVVSSSLQCSHPDVVAQQLQAAFGNANLCAAPVAAPANAAMLAGQKFSKVGDVSAADLDAAKSGMHANAVKPNGIIGNIACPIAINAAIGFLSNAVPAAWGCSGPNASISGLIGALTAACETAVPL